MLTEVNVFKIVEKTELNQISLTGIRALVMIGLLIIRPHSLEEIRKAFIDYQIMEKTHSNDILRIDLNTIKTMGCEISRSSAKTNFKYILTKHPFSLKIPENEVKALKKVYNYVREKADIRTLMAFHDMFSRIANHICDDETKEALLGISIFRYFDLEYIKDLMLDCKHNRILELFYKKPTSKKSFQKHIVAQELVCKNDKVYLHGYDLDKQVPIVLNLRGIEAIVSRKFEKHPVAIKQTEIKYTLKDIAKEELDINEEIVEECTDGILVKGSYHNKFIAMQRVLSFGNKCTVIEPLDFRNDVIKKIKDIRSVYVC